MTNYDINHYRSLFPLVKNGLTYLDHAAIGPFPTPVRDAVNAYVNKKSETEPNIALEFFRTAAGVRDRIGMLLNSPKERIALTDNTTNGLNILASGLEWKSGDRILLTDIEFPANVSPFLNQRRHGVEVDFVKSRGGRILPEDFERALTPKTRLLSVSHVQFLHGFRSDLGALGELCRRKGIIFCVDAIQSAGVVPIDVQAMKIDFLSSGCQKWLLAPEGVGFVYVSEPMQEKIHHANHPYVADTLRILSEICRGQGRYEEAERSLERAIAIIRSVRPEDGQEVAPFKVDMARLLTARGDYANAESYFKDAISVIDKSFGPEHLYTAKVRCSMATLYSLQGRNAEAETLISRALPIYEKVHGPDHHFLIPLWLVKARVNQTNGRTAEAQTLLDKSLRVARKTNCGRLIQGEVLTELGRFYLENKQLAKAQDALLQAVEMFENSQAVESAAAFHALARVYVEKGKYNEAQNLCRRALTVLEAVSDRAHPETADVLDTLVQLNRTSGNIKEVARLEQRVEEIRVPKS